VVTKLPLDDVGGMVPQALSAGVNIATAKARNIRCMVATAIATQLQAMHGDEAGQAVMVPLGNLWKTGENGTSGDDRIQSPAHLQSAA